MKIRITFKDPDAVYDTLGDVARESLPAHLSEEEYKAVYKERREKIEQAVKPWIQFGEYVTIEIDTEAKTAVVVPVRG